MSKTVNLSKVRRAKITARKNSIKKRANSSPSSFKDKAAYASYLNQVSKKICQIQKILKDIEELADVDWSFSERD